MHKIQQKILNLMDEKELSDLSLREIADLIGEDGSPQKIKHHIMQLEKKRKVILNRKGKPIRKIKGGKIKNNIISLPIAGSANCGPATILAEQNIEDYLRISKKLLKTNKKEDLFVIKAEGNSLNDAKIKGGPISEGDYVVIDGNYHNPKDGDYVLSIIDNMANLKRFKEDKKNNQIILESDSTEDIPPIYIHPDDDYIINGKIVQVIKNPKNN